jgi:hypothetical protein
MKNQGDSEQLSLNLITKVGGERRVETAAEIVPFIDANTLEARRNALRRVVRSGIFSLPPNLRLR